MANEGVVLSVEQAEEIERILLQSPGSAIRIMRSPYSGNGIVVSSEVVGEAVGSTLAEAMEEFLTLLLSGGSEVAPDEELPDTDYNLSL